MNYKQRFKHALLPVLLPVISYGILGPLEIYFGNASEFRFGLGDFVLPLLGAAVLAWLLCSAVLALVPGRAFRPASALVLGFGVASYAQNMFFNTKLSEADGSAMRWDTLGTYPAVNAAVWLVILAAAVALSLLLKKQWNTLCMAIPACLASCRRLLLTAGMVPLPGRAMPMASHRQFMELAVYIPAQLPQPGQQPCSHSVSLSPSMMPAL